MTEGAQKFSAQMTPPPPPETLTHPDELQTRPIDPQQLCIGLCGVEN